MSRRGFFVVGLFCLAAGSAARAHPPGLYVINYDTSQILRFDVTTPMSPGEVMYTSADGIRGPFGSNALLFDGNGNLLVGNYSSRDVLRFPDGVRLAGTAQGVNTPDGLAMTRNGAIYIANRLGQSVLRIGPSGDTTSFDAATGLGIPMSIVSDGSLLYVANSIGEIYRYAGNDPASRQLIHPFPYGPGVNVALAISPDGSKLYYLDNGVILKIDAATGNVLRTLSSGLGSADEGLVYVPGGPGHTRDLLFAADFAGVIYLIDEQTGDPAFFATRETGLAGPSGLAYLGASTACEGTLRCDANCDGHIDNTDIDPFILALIDPGGYAEMFPSCQAHCTADANGDGVIDNGDIDSFVQCLLAQ